MSAVSIARSGSRAQLLGEQALGEQLEIGDGAYLAAGSVITDPVPSDALALGRARQVTKPQWAAKRKKASEGQ